MGKRYYTALQLLLLSYRFCVDDPYDDDQDMVNISRIFHSVLVGSIHSHYDYHTMETSQDYSVITTDITEDHQVFKKELENKSDENKHSSLIQCHYEISTKLKCLKTR